MDAHFQNLRDHNLVEYYEEESVSTSFPSGVVPVSTNSSIPRVSKLMAELFSSHGLKEPQSARISVSPAEIGM
jgi:molecular chaperone DnaK (HSP70)